jgi:hemoglobin-like flavoprotein
MDSSISYQSVTRVHETWELARQKYSSEAEFGTEILLKLFRMAPGAKAVFGFDPQEDVENNSKLRASALVHGLRILQILDGILTLLGPNTEMLFEILSKLGDRHLKLGVDKEYILLIGSAIRECISDKLGAKYTSDDDESWKIVFSILSAELLRAMNR